MIIHYIIIIVPNEAGLWIKTFATIQSGTISKALTSLANLAEWSELAPHAKDAVGDAVIFDGVRPGERAHKWVNKQSRWEPQPTGLLFGEWKVHVRRVPEGDLMPIFA